MEGFNRLLALDIGNYLPGSVLAKVDRAAMAHGLEVRPPFLHGALVDWAFSLPSSLMLRGGRSKYLLKRAAQEHVPGEMVSFLTAFDLSEAESLDPIDPT